MPATIGGGPRYMFEGKQDVMAYVRKFGRPDLAITVTTYPKWPKILETLTPGQQPHDRSDPLVRVFRLRIQKPFADFERCLLWLFGGPGMRGLPHA